MEHKKYCCPPANGEDPALPWPGEGSPGTSNPSCGNRPKPNPSPIEPPVNEGEGGNNNGDNTQMPCDSIDPALLSLAMGFVPAQIWETPYDLDIALKRGTIFPSLDKPFLGEEATQR